MCSQEGLFDLENEKYVVSLSLIWAGLSSSLALVPPTGDKLQLGAGSPGARGPSISCLTWDQTICLFSVAWCGLQPAG